MDYDDGDYDYDDNENAAAADDDNFNELCISNQPLGLALLCVQCTSEESPECMVKEMIQICK